MNEITRTVDAVWRIESARIVATLAQMTGDIGLAEDLAQEALVDALMLGHLLPSVRGELLARPGRLDEARSELNSAADLAGNERESAVLRARAAAL